VADSVFNIAKGKVNEYVKRVDANDPANSAIVMVLLKSAGLETHAVLKDRDDLSVILAAANDECDFTNYARRVMSDTDLAVDVPDDTGDDFESAVSAWVIANAGGATNNTVGMLLICYDGDTTAGTDSNIVPLTMHDLTVTTDGTQLTISPSATSFFRAA
jgi:hypothetical protein